MEQTGGLGSAEARLPPSRESRRTPPTSAEGCLRALSLALPLVAITACQGATSHEAAPSGRAEALPIEHVPARLTPETVPWIANYSLEARLDEERHEIAGKGVIEWTNPSEKPTSELYFHLYLNAFSGPETLFMRGSGSRSGPRNGRPGRIIVRSLKADAFGDTELWPGPKAHTPSDDKDRTDIRVPLPRAIGGNETLHLRMEFTSILPEIVERTGYEDDFHFAGQWFPKLAKRETSGEWAHFPFHPHGEFYADFGAYEVLLDVPAHHVVGSTGKLSPLKSGDPGRKRYQAHAEGVHDFAWTSWPGFQVEERTLDGTLVRFLHPKYVPLAVEETWQTLQAGLRHLGASYGAYPYPELTVVHPPGKASRAGGMEYPQLITTGGSESSTLLGVRYVERVTIHELAHQWFQGMLASNEMNVPFLDEGLTSYAEGRYIDETSPSPSLLSLVGLDVSRIAGARFYHFISPSREPITQSAPDFPTFHDLATQVYARSTLCLETLGRAYSMEKLHAFLADYAHRYAFTHPDMSDFYATFEKHFGKQARKQAELMLDESASLHLSVGNVLTEKAQNGYATKIRIHKKGKLELPFSVLVRFEDGSSRVLPVLPPARDPSITFLHKSPVTFVHVDPEQANLLDEDLLDNRKFVSPPPLTSRANQRQSVLTLLTWLLSWAAP